MNKDRELIRQQAAMSQVPQQPQPMMWHGWFRN
jgi:hypothetical protein